VDHGFRRFGPRAKHVLAFLQLQSETVKLNRVYAYLSSIAFFHRRKGLDSPCDHVTIKLFMKGLKRRDASKTVKRAKPLKASMIRRAIEHLGPRSGLMVWRTVWRMCICFALFLRFDDVKRLKVKVYIIMKSSLLY